ncbi:MAG: FkbM family methyltransferase [Saprospiraceae bacterium]
MQTNTLQPLRTQFNLLKFHTKTWFAGCLFTLMGKKSVVLNGVDVLVPLDLADFRLRGQFMIGSYERQERRFLKTHLRPDAAVLELGGCLGIVSCVANRLLKHPERHIVLEANPKLIPYIQRNKEHTNSAFSVECCIISNNPENRFFASETIGSSSILRKTKNSVQISVPGKTIADLENTHQIKFDTLIMDIEGAELVFLRENRQWMRQIETVFMEIHPHSDLLSDSDVAECRQILEEAGLRIVATEDYIWVLQRNTN